MTRHSSVIEASRPAPTPAGWPTPWRSGTADCREGVAQLRCSGIAAQPAARSCDLPEGLGTAGGTHHSAANGDRPQKEGVASAVDSGAVPPGEHPPESAQHTTVAPAVGPAVAMHGAHTLHKTSDNREQQIQTQKPRTHPSDHLAPHFPSQRTPCFFDEYGPPRTRRSPLEVKRSRRSAGGCGTSRPRYADSRPWSDTAPRCPPGRPRSCRPGSHRRRPTTHPEFRSRPGVAPVTTRHAVFKAEPRHLTHSGLHDALATTRPKSARSGLPPRAAEARADTETSTLRDTAQRVPGLRKETQVPAPRSSFGSQPQ